MRETVIQGHSRSSVRYQGRLLGVCGSTISATRPVPVADDATRTRPAPKISTHTRPAGIPLPVAYPYDYITISVKPMARGGTAHVTHPNVI